MIFLCFYVSACLLPVGTFSFVNRLHFHNYRQLRPPIEITHHEPSALIGTVSFLPLYVHCIFVFVSSTKFSVFLSPLAVSPYFWVVPVRLGSPQVAVLQKKTLSFGSHFHSLMFNHDVSNTVLRCGKFFHALRHRPDRYVSSESPKTS